MRKLIPSALNGVGVLNGNKENDEAQQAYNGTESHLEMQILSTLEGYGIVANQAGSRTVSFNMG
jgi:hypothetical protein